MNYTCLKGLGNEKNHTNRFGNFIFIFYRSYGPGAAKAYDEHKFLKQIGNPPTGSY